MEPRLKLNKIVLKNSSVFYFNMEPRLK